MRKLSRWILQRYIFALLISMLAALACRHWVAEPYRVPHGRLQSVLLPGDVILVWKLGYSGGRARPMDGQVVLVRADDSEFKVNVFRVKELRESTVLLGQDGGQTLVREVPHAAVLGKVTRVLYSVEPRHVPASESKSWLSRLRLGRFFQKISS